MVALPDLSAIREQKGVTLEQIADKTKISKAYLRAIEKADFDALPGGVFNVSYIRQYARAIDYDEWDLLAYYASTRPENEPVATARERKLLGLFRLPEPVWRLLDATGLF